MAARIDDSVAAVVAFNEAINQRDVAALAELMTASHRFIDDEGAIVDGKDACLAAWRAFFESYPDYRNVFERVEDTGQGVVAVSGRSTCSFAALHGPALWRAVVVDGAVEVWQVSSRGVDGRAAESPERVVRGEGV